VGVCVCGCVWCVCGCVSVCVCVVCVGVGVCVYLKIGYFICNYFDINTTLNLLYAFFWVIPRRLNFICRLFGTLCLFHLHRQVGVELPRRKHTTFRKRRKFEVKNIQSVRDTKTFYG